MAWAPEIAPLKDALAIFVKTPGLSPIKTRLAHAISAAAAGEFYRLATSAIAAVVRDAIAGGIELTPYWAVAEHAALTHPDWREFPTVWQGHGELGDRLEHVYSGLLARHERVLLIGVDSPQISSAHLAEALAALHDPATRFTMGRARDGGFWLLGSPAEIPRWVWQSVHFSDSNTANELCRALATLGSIAYLSELTDVDTVNDLPYLQAELAALTAPVQEQLAVSAWIVARSFRSEQALKLT
ncbi:MAG TPA: DUF2064 domain-containing protein [Casimicrobiaceae bacterium]|nr:DUF2064 domain-containing protein [Casimicrobiaceae bacterium]